MQQTTNALLAEIDDYIKFLILEQKLEICICDISFPPICKKTLTQYNAHNNPYCRKVKGLKNGQARCVRMQKFVRNKCKEGAPFYGTCYAGVSEYVFPILENGEYLGFISVNTYRRENSLSEKRASSSTEQLSFPKIKTLLAPLVNCFRLLHRYTKKLSKNQKPRGQDRIYEEILAFLSENFLKNLSLNEIAEALHYSPSYLSHLFHEYHGDSIKSYLLELKIEKAKEFLLSTDWNVTQISETVGFTDANYFTAVFKKKTGIPPLKYRNL